MNAVRFAVPALLRSPVRSGLIILLLGVGLSFAVTSLALKLASDNRLDDIRTSVGTTGTITSNPAARQTLIQDAARRAQEEGGQPDLSALQSAALDLTESDLLTLSDLDYVELIDMNSTVGVNVPAWDDEESTNGSQTQNGQGQTGPGGGFGPGGGPGGFGGGFVANDVLLEGNINLLQTSAFAAGTRVLTEGRAFTGADVEDGVDGIVIDQDSAALYGYEVGTALELESSTQVLPPENEELGAPQLTVQVVDEAPEAGATSLSISVQGFNPPELLPGMSLFVTLDDVEYQVTVESFDEATGALTLASNTVPWAQGTLLRSAQTVTTTASVEVIGIYSNLETTAQAGFQQNLPTWYVPLSVVRKLQPENNQDTLTSATFSYGSADAAEQFTTDVAARLDPDVFLVVTDQAAFEDIKSSVNRLSTTSQVGLIAGLSVVGVIMILLMALVVRSRFREIGILKAIGARNTTVVGQFAVETVVLSLAAAVLAVGISFATGAVVADSFKSAAATSGSDQTDATAQTSQPTNQGGGAFPGGGPGGGRQGFGPGAFGQLGTLAAQSDGATDAEIDAAIDSIDMSISPGVVGLSFGAALFVAMIGAAVPTFFVVRMRPAQVLRFDA